MYSIEYGEEYREDMVFVVPPNNLVLDLLKANNNSLEYCIYHINTWYGGGHLKMALYMFDAVANHFGFDYYRLGGVNFKHGIVTSNCRFYVVVQQELLKKAMYEGSVFDNLSKAFRKIIKALGTACRAIH